MLLTYGFFDKTLAICYNRYMTVISETPSKIPEPKEIIPLQPPYDISEQLFRTTEDIPNPSDPRLTYAEFLRKSPGQNSEEWRVPIGDDAALKRELAHTTGHLLELLSQFPQEDLADVRAALVEAVSAISPPDPTTDINSTEKSA